MAVLLYIMILFYLMAFLVYTYNTRRTQAWTLVVHRIGETLVSCSLVRSTVYKEIQGTPLSLAYEAPSKSDNVSPPLHAPTKTALAAHCAHLLSPLSRS